jgi:eukaryotic-like serine/threonine-protein kinase
MIGCIFLGRYEATRLLGEGGMGRVFLARQVDLPDRQVVVKVMHDDIAADVKFRERFQHEIQLMGKFEHPYAVRLYDFSLDDPQGPCIIMEYVKGVGLDLLLKKNGRFTPARVGRLLGQLCEALQAAHDRGIIHRDLKPANLMVIDADTPREKIKVMDFGLAQTFDAAALKKITEANNDFAVGTPAYICPEQVRGENMDHRGDIYSVGVLIYELLTGELPFPGPNPRDMLLAHATEFPPTFEQKGVAEWVPPSVERVVMRCLAKDPADRPQSAYELAMEYETALAAVANALPAPAPIPVENGHVEDKPFQPLFIAPPDDPNAILFTLEAWMPTMIAMVKLEGYVHDVKGEVLASDPGIVRVKLPSGGSHAPKPRRSWLGFALKPGPIILEMHLQQMDGGRENQLQIQARFRPGDQTPATDEFWRARCVAHFCNLRGYLIGQTAAV